MKLDERSRRLGFTLLEVMAAVAVLGIVYVVLARGAMQGLQIEGDAGRRLRASLLADRILNDLELELAAGSAPRVGESETSEEEFAVVVEVSPFDVASILPATEEGEASAAPTSSKELLAPSRRGGVPTLLSITVRVAWIEGVSEREVTRTSFAFDAEAAAPLLEGIGDAEEKETDEEAEEEEEEFAEEEPR
jgi:prepilin-type N-terminal cleavage/methylation domain-containing protein